MIITLIFAMLSPAEVIAPLIRSSNNSKNAIDCYVQATSGSLVAEHDAIPLGLISEDLTRLRVTPTGQPDTYDLFSSSQKGSFTNVQSLGTQPALGPSKDFLSFRQIYEKDGKTILLSTVNIWNIKSKVPKVAISGIVLPKLTNWPGEPGGSDWADVRNSYDWAGDKFYGYTMQTLALGRCGAGAKGEVVAAAVKAKKVHAAKPKQNRQQMDYGMSK